MQSYSILLFVIKKERKKKLKFLAIMGSLMAGWDSPFSDSETVKYQRNKSLTKEEIETYWRSKKQTTTDHEQLKANSLSSKSFKECIFKDSGRQLQRSNSLPLTDRKGNFLNVDSETATEKLMKTNDWWTRSNWAFLNEPPVISEGPTYKYASQYHLTRFGPSSKPNARPEIST